MSARWNVSSELVDVWRAQDASLRASVYVRCAASNEFTLSPIQISHPLNVLYKTRTVLILYSPLVYIDGVHFLYPGIPHLLSLLGTLLHFH